MKKFVFASVMALASISLVSAPMLRAQDSITIKDPAEFNAYQMATTQSDPKAKAAGSGELSAHLSAERRQEGRSGCADGHLPGQLGNADKALSAASRLLQVDPNNMKAIFHLGLSSRRPSAPRPGRADLRRCRGAGPQGPGDAKARRHLRCRLEEADRRRPIRSSTPR